MALPSRADFNVRSQKMTPCSPSGKSLFRLGLKAIAAAVGDQDGGTGRILLDLLAQAVDVGFERMRRDARVVTPDLVQQDIARHRAVTGTKKVFQDRGFLVGEPDLLLAALID